MTVWAHVRAGLVVATSEGDTAPVDDRSTLVQLEPSDGVVLPGFTYDGVVFTPAGPDADEDAARERALADAIEVQVWRYPPTMAGDDPGVDPLSLWLSLADHPDPRVRMALDEVQSALPW